MVDFSYEALAAALGLLVGGRYVRTLDCMRRNGGARESLVREGPTWEALRHLRFDFVGEAVRDAAMRLSEDFALVAKAQAAARDGLPMSMFEKQEAAKQAQSPAFKARSEEIRMHLELSQEITRRLGADRPPPGEEGHDDDAEPATLAVQIRAEQNLATGLDDGGHKQPAPSMLREADAALELLRPAVAAAADGGDGGDGDGDGDDEAAG